MPLGTLSPKWLIVVAEYIFTISVKNISPGQNTFSKELVN